MQMSARVEDLESSFKNLAHNVQGFSEPIRHPCTPNNRKRRPVDRTMTIEDETYGRAVEVRGVNHREGPQMWRSSCPGLAD